MKLAKIYGLLWILALAVGAALYLTDMFSFDFFIIWGFIVHALAGAGLLVVFPAVMAERVVAENNTSKPEKRSKFPNKLSPTAKQT